jgi:hypothetical protein
MLQVAARGFVISIMGLDREADQRCKALRSESDGRGPRIVPANEVACGEPQKVEWEAPACVVASTVCGGANSAFLSWLNRRT